MPRPRLLTDAQVEEMAELYRVGFDMERLGTHYGTSSATIRKWLLRSGVKTHGHAVLVESQERDAINMYDSGVSTLSIGSHFGCSQQTISNILQRRGIVLRKPGGFRRLPVRDDAFDVPTPESAYWIGILMTDGCVTGDKQGVDQLKLCLKIEDSGHLQAFKEFLGSGHAISLDVQRHPLDIGRELGMCRFAVRSRRLVEALARYGVVPRKTDIALAQGGVEDSIDFWRGAIDGDGHVGIHHHAQAPNACLKLSGASETFIVQFRDFLLRRGVFGQHVVREESKTNSLGTGKKYVVHLTARAAIEDAALLYVGAAPAMPRKARAAAEMIMRGSKGELVGTVREPYSNWRAIEWAEDYLVAGGEKRRAA